MDILKMAENSGLLVILDGRIGQEEYRSVHGSITALSRFANAVMECASKESPCFDSATNLVPNLIRSCAGDEACT